MEQIKNIIFDVGDVLLSYRWKYMLMDYGISEICRQNDDGTFTAGKWILPERNVD